MSVTPLDLSKLKVFPLAERCSLTRADDIAVDPDRSPPPCSEEVMLLVADCAEKIRAAQARGASVILIYGAHLLRNGAVHVIGRMLAKGWLTHLATNGAGTIHDWEYAWFGASTEGVRANVATGTFGTWDETATNIHLAIMAGALDGLGYGRALGRFIHEDGASLPTVQELETSIAREPRHPLTGARVDLLHAMISSSAGRLDESSFIIAGRITRFLLMPTGRVCP